MKLCFLLPSFLLLSTTLAAAAKPDVVILDATAVRNLRIETTVVESADFEETVFALGRIEPLPGSVAAVASLISGRVAALTALPGDTVTAGAEVIRIESRQPGQPSPVIGLHAPLSGLVTRLDVRLGDPVEPDRALLEITNLDEVLAIARVPEHEAGRIPPGATAHIRLAAWPQRSLQGRLLRFGTAADPAGGTLDAVFSVANPDGRLRPGMRAEFSIVVAERPDVTAVPRDAIQGPPTDRHVYVKDFDLLHAFIKTPVVTGQGNDRFVEIVSGLFPADEVVTRGAYALSFAGAGSVSLKEALDAAHGHAHNDDGSELGGTPGQPTDAGPDHDDHGASHPALPWIIATGVLTVALIVNLLRQRAVRR